MTLMLPGSPEWHAFRATGITASESPAVVGLSPYETARHIYERKLGNLPEIVDNAAMRFGRKLEPIVVCEFCEVTGEVLLEYPVPPQRHVNHECVIATPDARLESKSLLEVKTTNWRIAKALGEEGTDYIPEHWLVQTQQQLAVTGLDLCHLACLIDGRTLKMFKVYRNGHLIDLLIAAATELWNRIIDRRPPEPNWFHSRTEELLKELYGVAEGTMVTLDESAAEAWTLYEHVGEEIRDLEKVRKAAKAKVLYAIGESAVGRMPDGQTEIIRRVVPEKEISYVRSSYIDTRSRKVKDNGSLSRASTDDNRSGRIDTTQGHAQAVALLQGDLGPVGPCAPQTPLG